MDRDKTINVIFMKQQEEVVLSDLPIFGIISTKGQSFHTVEALDNSENRPQYMWTVFV